MNGSVPLRAVYLQERPVTGKKMPFVDINVRMAHFLLTIAAWVRESFKSVICPEREREKSREPLQ
jgi:hypothetical protein